jgi:hypothetical protein
MAHIALRALDAGREVILVGSDAPSLDADYVRRAVGELASADAVFGPALDGGYVLLGLRVFCEALFTDMPWGTDRVLEVSLSRLEAAGFSYRLLDALPDIDRPEDLRYLPDDLRW